MSDPESELNPGLKSHAWSDPVEERGRGGVSVFGCVLASLAVHFVFSAAMPAIAAILPPRVEPPIEVAFFMVEEPEPEPEPEPELVAEPEPEPAPEPVRERRPEPEAEPEIAPEPEPQTDEPEGTPDAAEEVADDQEIIAQATVASTEGGLAVGVPAGDGSPGAVRGTRHAGPIGRPAPPAEPEIDRRALRRQWNRLVYQALGRPDYPRAARRSGVEGTVLLAISIDARGRIVRIRVKESSGVELLDQAAVEQYGSIAEVPAPPAELEWRTRELTVPVQYAYRPARRG